MTTIRTPDYNLIPISKSKVDSLHDHIRQLEGEVERYKAVNENARAERAFRCLEAVWRRGYLNSGERLAKYIMDDVIALEIALKAQAEMDRGNE